MQSLFQIQNDLSTGAFRVPVWDYVRNTLQSNFEKITNHYRLYPIPAKSSHLLIDIITTMSVSRTLPFDRYIANCTQRSMNVAQTLKLTSSLSKGKIWNDQFYGGCEEIIIGHQERFDVWNSYENWRDLAPVEILDHPQSNLDMWIPDGSVSSMEKGFASIAINIPMLMAQWYMFCLEQDVEERAGKPRRTINQFVGSYPLINAIKSQTDIARTNALINYIHGVPSLKCLKRHSMFLVSVTDSLQTVMKQEMRLLDAVSNKGISGILRQVPAVFKENLSELSELPGMADNVQVLWALIASRLKILALSLNLNKHVEKMSTSELERIRWRYRVQNADSALKSNLGLRGYYMLAPYLDRLKMI